jgi:hypothetical protein
MLIRGMGAGLGDDFERDNFDYVQAAVAATPPAAVVAAPASWTATPFSSAPTPIQQPEAVAQLAAAQLAAAQAAAAQAAAAQQAAAAAAAAVPAGAAMTVVGGAIPVGSANAGPGPNVTALQATMAAAGVQTDQQAQAWLSSLDGQPVQDNGLTEDQAGYYLGLIAQKAQHKKWLELGVAGAAALGLVLLLRR